LIYAAAYNNNPEVIALLLENGADVNAEKNKGTTALMHAASDNNPEIAALLLKSGANVNTEDDQGMTALMFAAAFNNNPEAVALLLENGANVNAGNNRGTTALMRAAARDGDNLEIIALLLINGADVNAVDNERKTALMRAAARDNNPEAVALLLNSGADVNAEDNGGRTVLAYAGAPEIGSILKQYEENGLTMPRNETPDEDPANLAEFPQSRDNAASRVSSAVPRVEPFLRMCAAGKPKDVEDAIRDGADVNAPDRRGITPLMAAAWNDNPDVLPILIEHGSKLDAADNSGWTALTMPISLWKTAPRPNDRTEKVITILVENGIDVNMPNEDGATPLMLAAMYGEPRIVEILLDAGADIDAKDKSG
jgi:serine/threonine-protein phosphatase 6 regulatory ankyrin repeat subunit B